MKTDVAGVEEINSGEFAIGQRYDREALHQVYGGQKYRGIATPSDYPLIFIFTGESGEEYGYEDEFTDDGRFLYTGEGRTGDMEFTGGNKAIRDHRKNGEEIHLFENRPEAWVVTYVGQFELVGIQRPELEDQNGDYRQGIRFELAPVGGTEIEAEPSSTGGESLEDLYERAQQSAPTEQEITTETRTTTTRTYNRSQAVREYALAAADGVCQGCGEDAPFLDESGEPFLEVHHLYRRSDGGPDDPENVVALCPNCHRRVHHGQDGEEFNQRLMES